MNTRWKTFAGESTEASWTGQASSGGGQGESAQESQQCRSLRLQDCHCVAHVNTRVTAPINATER